ncbi:MAG: caspase family protein [Acidobacteria bacterium]|nr:caspase family protein [Acidobacteriota bacterium]
MGWCLKLPLLLTTLAGLHASTWHVTISGLGGEAAYETRFNALATESEKLLKSSPDSNVKTLAGADATKANIQKALAEIAKTAQPADTLIVTIIGHGNFDGTDYKINIPGADVTALELGEWMDKISAQKQAVINTTSCSGASIDALKRDHRVIVTATKSATERLATQFPRFWVEALRNPEADTDKNEQISVLEAYRYADRRVTDFYETQKRLATEHAMIEDTGKASGVRTPSPDNGHGLLAGQTVLIRFGSLQQAAKSPEKQALLKKREEIESNIEKLKYEKAAYDVATYRKQLSTLLVELAKLQEEIDK